jgi:hypothetical protein
MAAIAILPAAQNKSATAVGRHRGLGTRTLRPLLRYPIFSRGLMPTETASGLGIVEIPPGPFGCTRQVYSIPEDLASRESFLALLQSY